MFAAGRKNFVIHKLVFALCEAPDTAGHMDCNPERWQVEEFDTPNRGLEPVLLVKLGIAIAGLELSATGNPHNQHNGLEQIRLRGGPHSPLRHNFDGLRTLWLANQSSCRRIEKSKDVSVPRPVSPLLSLVLLSWL